VNAVEFLREVASEHGDGPVRVHAHHGGRLLLCWEVSGREWDALMVGDDVTVVAPGFPPIATTFDGDPAFRTAVLAATLACKEGVSA
jgi:hypothetical protein